MRQVVIDIPVLWGPAVDNHKGFGRRAFVAVKAPWDGKAKVQRFLKGED
jgi:hypothetical protein